MGEVLVIGAGGVASVAVHKMAQAPERFGRITLASRGLAKCDAIAAAVKARHGVEVRTAAIDADDVDATAALIERVRPDLVVHLALPYQDLSIMAACLRAGADYLDTANYEHPDAARFEYGPQWALHERFAAAGRMALLGSGFDPGVTSVFATYIARHLLDRIDTIDILDCNGGDHGLPFATNFNPEINLREVTAPARHWEDGRWVEGPAMAVHQRFAFAEVGERTMYLMYHEELESLARFMPGVRRIRFWMTFGESYLRHLEVLRNVGLTRIDPVMHDGHPIVPLQFLKTLLSDPASLGPRTRGKTNIGVIASGAKDGAPRTVYLYNVCDHEAAFAETGSQAVSYTTGVPAAIGAALMLDGTWRGAGVFNVEQLDPDPFMAMLGSQGLPWRLDELPAPLAF